MADDLTDAQHDALADKLHALEAALEAQLGSATGDGRPVALDTAFGRVSRVDAIQQQQMVKATRHRAQGRLIQVRAALDRVAAGDYGDCARCGDPIGFGRLDARPETPLCVGCQGEAEARRR
ncbi:MAG: molecular chaperone DnaK [Deltaproteobacteria bacterium HGW-Deltaproteobacteria-14]|jgi:DnaK suppressor protein|nr:MAG: molecular chaperone DnaK [Deltaproteobacteria bacterium HGW-Deltaproteobacteria-14]